MTISNTTIRSSDNGNGVTTAFSVTFPFYEDTDLTVVLVDTSDVEAAQTITTEYTVSGGAGSTGTVTMVTPPASGERLVIYRASPLTQDADYPEGDPFPAATHEAALDRLTMQNQEQSDKLGRALTLSESTEIAGDVSIEEPIAGRGLKWNSAGDGIENTDNDLDALGASVSADATQTALDRLATAADLVLTNADVVSAGNSESQAAASATAAALSASSNWASTIQNKSNLDSPIAPVLLDDGTIFVCDTTSGAITINLPSVVTVGEGYRIGIINGSGLNDITINRDGTDTIVGLTSFTLTDDTQYIGLAADDSTPDNWIIIAQSAVQAGNGLTKTGATISLSGGVLIDADGNLYRMGANVITDATTALTLSTIHNGSIIRMTNAAANIVTLPQTSTEALPVGFQCTIVQAGAGATTIHYEGTDTINGASTDILLTAQRSGSFVYKAVAGTPNEYEVLGAFA